MKLNLKPHIWKIIIPQHVILVAGIVSMDKKKFMFFNTLSSFLWSFILVFSGHYLYGVFLNYGIDLKEHIEMIVIGIILISTFPVFLKLLKKRPQDK